jgi:hypothetical protein
MGHISLLICYLCTFFMFSAMSITLNDNALEDDVEKNSDLPTSARHLLQTKKTAYTMPKLNFCENIHDSIFNVTSFALLHVCSETQLSCQGDM